MRLVVVCGRGETIATLRPTSWFTSVDLPTFGRPRIATKPERNSMAGIILLRQEQERIGNEAEAAHCTLGRRATLPELRRCRGRLFRFNSSPARRNACPLPPTLRSTSWGVQQSATS